MTNNKFKCFLKKAFSGRMAIVSSIVALLLVGATLALLFSVGSEIVNKFNPGSVDVEVWEKTESDTKTIIKLTNTGTTNAFLRASIVTYYVDANKNVVGSIPAALSSFNLSTNWEKGSDGYYYYKKPVAPGGLTDNLFASTNDKIKLTPIQQEVDGKTVTYYQVVEVFAEAIQSAPVDAVKKAWGTGFDINSDGTIKLPTT